MILPGSARLILQSVQFQLIEMVLWKLFGQTGQQLSRRISIVIAESGDDEQETRVGGQVAALISCDLQVLNAFGFVGLSARQSQHPASGRRTQAEHVVFETDRQVCIVIFRIDRNQLLSAYSG